MKHKAFVLLCSSGTPVALSTGVPLFTKTQRVTGCSVHTRSYEKGGFDHPILMPGLGPGINGWSSSIFHPSGHPRTAEVLDKVDKGYPVDFSQLTTPEVFFTRDPKGKFVLMDAWNRKRILVSPLDEDLKAGFWSGIQDAFKGIKDDKWSGPVGLDAWMPPAGVQKLLKHEVWVCLNPAPYHKDRPVAWSWDGARSVAFDFTPRPETPRPGVSLTPQDIEALNAPWTPEQERVEEERLFGLTPYTV